MTNDLLLVLIGLGVIVIIAAIFVIYTVKKSGDKKEANEFLETLSKQLKSLIIDIIRNFDPKDIQDLDEDKIATIETQILKKIYDTCWECIRNIVKEKSQEEPDFFTSAVLALLENRDFVEEFINNLITNTTTQSIIHSRAVYISNNIEEDRITESEERDRELQEEFSDQDKYIEEITDEDQTHGEEVEVPTEEELAQLNPQVDEPEELDPENDPSVEVIEDEEDDIYYDKSGRPRSRKTGKWVKVNK
jgi:hypothetical protein